jgi:hypothetical protein
MPAEIVFLWTSRPRNVGVVVVDMDGWLLPYVATSAFMVADPRKLRNGPAVPY